MARGRPFEPGNTFGRGRPPGSKNKTTVKVQELFDSYAVPVARKVIQMAILGDTKAQKMCMDRVAPVRREETVKFGPLPTSTAAEVSKATEKVVQDVAAGKIPIAQGLAMSGLLEMRRRAVETESLDGRVRNLEERQ